MQRSTRAITLASVMAITALAAGLRPSSRALAVPSSDSGVPFATITRNVPLADTSVQDSPGAPHIAHLRAALIHQGTGGLATYVLARDPGQNLTEEMLIARRGRSHRYPIAFTSATDPEKVTTAVGDYAKAGKQIYALSIAGAPLLTFTIKHHKGNRTQIDVLATIHTDGGAIKGKGTAQKLTAAGALNAFLRRRLSLRLVEPAHILPPTPSPTPEPTVQTVDPRIIREANTCIIPDALVSTPNEPLDQKIADAIANRIRIPQSSRFKEATTLGFVDTPAVVLADGSAPIEGVLETSVFLGAIKDAQTGVISIALMKEDAACNNWVDIERLSSTVIYFDEHLNRTVMAANDVLDRLKGNEYKVMETEKLYRSGIDALSSTPYLSPQVLSLLNEAKPFAATNQQEGDFSKEALTASTKTMPLPPGGYLNQAPEKVDPAKEPLISGLGFVKF